MYRTRAIITRSRFETALDYKPRIFGSIEGFSCLVHKLAVILTASNGARKVFEFKVRVKIKGTFVSKACTIMHS